MSFTISINTEDLVALVPNIERIGTVIPAGAARALNAVGQATRDDSVRIVSSKVYLTEQYVDTHVHFAGRDRATPTKLTATIRGEDRPARLDRFFTTRANTVSNVWTKGKFDARFGAGALVSPRPGAKRLPWTERTGRKAIGIPAGLKIAGVFANVSRNKPGRILSSAYYVPFREGKVAGAGGMGVVRRESGKQKALYGPSVDQVVRNVWKDNEAAIGEKLQALAADEVMKEVNDVLGAK